LIAGNLTINGTQILGTTVAATPAALANLINSHNAPGVIASVNDSGQLRLTAPDGRNIQLQTNGTAASMNFTNFATGGLYALDKCKRGQFNLTIPNNQSITIGGNIPGNANLTPGIQCGVFQCCSDNICLTFTSSNEAHHQSIIIPCNQLTQFSAPFVINAEQDGHALGNFTGFTIDPTGEIIGNYTNGKTIILGKIILAYIPDQRHLKEILKNHFTTTKQAGCITITTPGNGPLGLSQSGALEADIADHHYEPSPFHETRSTGVPLTLAFNRLNSENAEDPRPLAAGPTTTTTTATSNCSSEPLPKNKGL
jgi:flagellar hook protein FlgE